jgi:hypothetical protein
MKRLSTQTAPSVLLKANMFSRKKLLRRRREHLQRVDPQAGEIRIEEENG